MKIKFTLISSFILFVTCVNAQNNYIRLDQIQGVPMTITYNLDEEKDIEGSRYFNDEWKEIRVETIDEVNILIPEGKLDTYIDEIIVKNAGGAFILDRKSEIESFTINDDKFVTSTYVNGQLGYFQELYKGSKVILYKKESCIIQRGKPSNGIVDGTPDRFEKTTDYFVKKVEENSEALKLKVRKRKVLLKNSKMPELSIFLDKSKEGYESDQQLIELFKKYDER